MMNFTTKDSFSCSSCVSLSSQVQKFINVVDSKFKEISSQFEHMCIRLSNVEESMSKNDKHSIINEIERELSVVADKLKNYLLRVLLLRPLIPVLINYISLLKLIKTAVLLHPIICLRVALVLTLIP